MVTKNKSMNFWKMSVPSPKSKTNLKMPQLKAVQFIDQSKIKNPSNAPFKPMYPVPSFRLHPMFRKANKQQNSSFLKEPLPKMAKKDMKWSDAKRKYPKLSPFKDADKDGIMNMFDCHPFDKKRQGFMHSRKAGADLNKLYEFEKSPKERKRFSSRDVLEREPGKVRAILHHTPIAELETNKNLLTVRTGGYQTVTTKARINKALPENLGIKQEKGKWMVLDQGGKKYKFKEDMKIKIDPSTKYGELVDGEEVIPKRKIVPLPSREDINKAFEEAQNSTKEENARGYYQGMLRKKEDMQDFVQGKQLGVIKPELTFEEYKAATTPKGFKISTKAGNINEAMDKLGEKMGIKIEKVSKVASLKGDEAQFETDLDDEKQEIFEQRAEPKAFKVGEEEEQTKSAQEIIDEA